MDPICPLTEEKEFDDAENAYSTEFKTPLDFPRGTLRVRNKGSHCLSKIARSPMLFHLILIAAYTCIYMFGINRQTPNQVCEARDLIYSPARSALKYEKQVFTSELYNNSFTGEPRPELDATWHNLLKNIHIKVPKSDIDRINGTTLALADGSGYLASLEVYHDLHCLKRIRQWIHRDIYHPNMTEEDYTRNYFHIDHCIEHFREVAMCRGDVALTTFYYRPNGQITAKLLAEHECVNWDGLNGWAKEHAMDLSITSLMPPDNIHHR